VINALLFLLLIAVILLIVELTLLQRRIAELEAWKRWIHGLAENENRSRGRKPGDPPGAWV
jgi:hypothetical protein